MHIKANGIRINYELSPRPDAATVVLSHSLGSSLAMWDPQMEVLRTHFSVLRYDTRGHGGTDAPPGDYTLDQLVTDAVGLLDALGIDRVHWVGLSMGGMIAQGLALQHADRLQSLVLCDTAARIPSEAQPVWQERIDAARRNGMQPLAQPTLERWFTPAYLAENPPGVALIRRHFLATPVAGYIGCSQAIRGLDYLEQLPAVRTPTLIIVGEEDLGTPVAAAEAIHRQIKGSQLVVIPSAAHLSNVEQAEAFNRALIPFLLDAAD